jgi:hypothetical protein
MTIQCDEVIDLPNNHIQTTIKHEKHKKECIFKTNKKYVNDFIPSKSINTAKNTF